MKMLGKYLIIMITFVFFSVGTAQAEKSHSFKVGEKLGAGLANVTTGFVEIPKTMIISGKQNGAFYGASIGFITGLGQMLGRTLFGTLDLITFMIPTQPLVHPEFIWNDFNKETSYSTNWQMRK